MVENPLSDLRHFLNAVRIQEPSKFKKKKRISDHSLSNSLVGK